MSEEEIIAIMEELKEAVRYKTVIENEERNEWKREYTAIQGLLDLYNKEKEKYSKKLIDFQKEREEYEREIKEYKILFKRQKELQEEKDDLIKQGWLDE